VDSLNVPDTMYTKTEGYILTFPKIMGNTNREFSPIETLLDPKEGDYR